MPISVLSKLLLLVLSNFQVGSSPRLRVPRLKLIRRRTFQIGSIYLLLVVSTIRHCAWGSSSILVALAKHTSILYLGPLHIFHEVRWATLEQQDMQNGFWLKLLPRNLIGKEFMRDGEKRQ